MSKGYIEVSVKHAELMAQIKELERENIELRVVLAGRITPPTDAELAIHELAGGSWLCATQSDLVTLHGRYALTHATTYRNAGMVTRWWPLDSTTGAPCVWPNATREATNPVEDQYAGVPIYGCPSPPIDGELWGKTGEILVRAKGGL